MAISEAERADLYTGFVEVFGPKRAEILMTQLPRFDPVEVATSADLAVLRSDFDDLRDEFSDLRSDFSGLRGDFSDLRGDFSGLSGDFSDLRAEFSDLRSEVKDEISDLRKEMSDRLDRLYTTLVAGLFVIVAAMAGVFFTTL